MFPKPIEKWFDLEQDDKHCGKIYLRIALGTGKPLEAFFQDYVQILHLLVLSELDKYGSNNIPIYWDENFDKWSNSVLGQLKLQGGLISKHVVLAKWMVYSIVNSIIPLDSKMMYLLMDAVLGKISAGDYDEFEVRVRVHSIFTNYLRDKFQNICNLDVFKFRVHKFGHIQLCLSTLLSSFSQKLILFRLILSQWNKYIAC